MKSRYLFASTLAVCVGANLVAVIYFQTLLSRLVPLNFESRPPESDTGFLVYTMVTFLVSFGVPTGLIGWYMAPMLKALRSQGTPDSALDELAVRRFQNYPLVSALIGMAGWFVAFLGSIVGGSSTFSLTGTGAVVTYFGGYFLKFSGAAVLTFVFSYFLLEVLNRKLFLVELFPRGVPTDTPGVFRISVRTRFLLFSFAVSGYPLMLLAGSLGFVVTTNPLAETGLWFIATFLIMAFALTLLVAQFYQTPLVEMKAAVEEIRRENYAVQVPVTSGDEVGHLGEGINTMAVELKDKGFMKETFGKTVDPAVRDHLLSGHLDLGGSLQPAAILFSDLRDFTTFSESLPPSVVVGVLNRYFARMSAVVSSRGGFVNKFMGDAILALFNLPLPRENYASEALRAALAMQTALDELNVEFLSEGLPPLKMGIGLHAGVVMAGTIGSPQRMEYTVIGDPVNAASRLENLTKDYGAPLLVSRELVDLVGNDPAFELQSRGRAAVKGRAQGLEVFTASLSPRA